MKESVQKALSQSLDWALPSLNYYCCWPVEEIGGAVLLYF